MGFSRLFQSYPWKLLNNMKLFEGVPDPLLTAKQICMYIKNRTKKRPTCSRKILTHDMPPWTSGPYEQVVLASKSRLGSSRGQRTKTSKSLVSSWRAKNDIVSLDWPHSRQLPMHYFFNDLSRTLSCFCTYVCAIVYLLSRCWKEKEIRTVAGCFAKLFHDKINKLSAGEKKP